MKAAYTQQQLSILLITEEEQEFVLIRDLLSQLTHTSYKLHWVHPLAVTDADIKHRAYQICLVDYRFAKGFTSGWLQRLNLPLLLLLEQNEIDSNRLARMDFLLKDQLSASLLERRIHWALQLRCSKKSLAAVHHSREATTEQRNIELQLENERLRRELEQLSWEVEQHKLAASGLRRSAEERFRNALDSSSILFYNTDRELRYTWAFDPSEEEASERYAGKRDDQILAADDVADLVAFKQSVLATETAAR